MDIPIMQAPTSGVTVRMYRAGLGDCFLLAFRGVDHNPVYMLIDCGIHSQYKGGGKVIKKIAQHVHDTTGGHLHVLVMTHEHGDHISGFHTAKETFQSMKIEQGWFAWTEDPDNAFAQRIDRARSLMLQGLHAAAPALAAAGNTEAAEQVTNLTDFFRIGEGMGVSSRETRNLILELSNESRYLKPKMPPQTLPGVDGVRIFVLGPPEDERMLMRARPSSSRPGQVYREEGHGLALDDVLSAAFLAAAGQALADEQRESAEAGKPFASNLRLAQEVVQANPKRFPFFHAHYGFAPDDPESWRHIDSDWQLPAESLALKLDAATNNTSLVLAIELQATGRVLLFAGDAQVGNWESWHEGGWSEANGLGKDETLNAEELLHRTVLYKVGHHGSHNATLREKGLEMMTSPELSAMIPVDNAWALKRRPHPWKMPFDPLYEDLLRRTGGRILRSDLGLVKPPRKTAAWDEFARRVRADHPLYVELEIPDD